jgi:hypothetical protein
MTKSRNTSVKAEAIGEDIFNVIRTNRLEIGVMCALGYDYYGLALPDLAVLDCEGQLSEDNHIIRKGLPVE